MKSLITYKHLTLALLTTLLFSCQKDEFLDTPQAKTPEKQVQHKQITHPDKLIGLGKKMENPYTVSVMRKACDNLKANVKTSEFSTLSSELTISITD